MSLMEKLFRVDKSCPRCAGTTVDLLQRQGLFDTLLGIWRLRPYHCRRCYVRFYVVEPESGAGPPTRPRAKPRR